jgi:hypothetical protein
MNSLFKFIAAHHSRGGQNFDRMIEGAPRCSQNILHYVPLYSPVRHRSLSCWRETTKSHKRAAWPGADQFSMIIQAFVAFLVTVWTWFVQKSPFVYRTRRHRTVVELRTAMQAFLLGAVPFNGWPSGAPPYRNVVTRLLDAGCELLGRDLLSDPSYEALHAALCSVCFCGASVEIQPPPGAFWHVYLQRWWFVSIPDLLEVRCIPAALRRVGENISDTVFRHGGRSTWISNRTSVVASLGAATSKVVIPTTNATAGRGPPIPTVVSAEQRPAERLAECDRPNLLSNCNVQCRLKVRVRNLCHGIGGTLVIATGHQRPVKRSRSVTCSSSRGESRLLTAAQRTADGLLPGPECARPSIDILSN